MLVTLVTWVDKPVLVAKLQKDEALTTFQPLFLSGAAFAVYKQLPKEVMNGCAELKRATLDSI